MNHVERLSAMPQFLRDSNLWAGLLSPLSRFGKLKIHQPLRVATGSHRRGSFGEQGNISNLGRREQALLDIARGFLERGLWTLPTWGIEQQTAKNFELAASVSLVPIDSRSGCLGFKPIQKNSIKDPDKGFHNALVTARWQCEITDFESEIDRIWRSQEQTKMGSAAEEKFLRQVLAPVLRFPLLDFLRLQPDALSLGLDPIEFHRQRPDFVLENFRGLRLVIEVDGGQHEETGQKMLDDRRKEALKKAGFTVWSVQTKDLADIERLRKELTAILHGKEGKPHWGIEQLISKPRSGSIINCVWGPTANARVQSLIIDAIDSGFLSWDGHWKIKIDELDTNVAAQATSDFQSWFGRLRILHGFSDCPKITNPSAKECPDIILYVSVLCPRPPVNTNNQSVFWSCPANEVAPEPRRKFRDRLVLNSPPSKAILEKILQDFFRKKEFREGQVEILARALSGRDVVGLLPTGAGKSLTYQLAGLLLGGLTIYVSPLKSLLQDQRESLLKYGIDLAQAISSDLETEERQMVEGLLKTGGIRYLLIAPERFLNKSFRDTLDQFRAQFGGICQIVIDECHCVSEWGHDFRPAYLSLGRIARARTKRLNVSAPLVALTGTASSIVLDDVQRELGVTSPEATVRAKGMDRPEISMTVLRLSQSQKHYEILRLVREFMINYNNPTEGLLVFCRFAGGKEGVIGTSAALASEISPDDLRFFSGSSPNWRQYTAFRRRKKAADLSNDEVDGVIPDWARSSSGSLDDWAQVKMRNQRDFISGNGDNSFRVMVATNAFGMGIDKPSIRHVIHIMAPQSPEAYYQEVGRAARDQLSATATLLFSDEHSSTSDELLSPQLDISEAKDVYERFCKENQYAGGDFIRTFYFHNNRFAGPDDEAIHVIETLKNIRDLLTRDSEIIIPYRPVVISENQGESTPKVWNQETNLEFAIVRLMVLGVVDDYTKDYNKKHYEVILEKDWVRVRADLNSLTDYLATRFQIYLSRYEINPDPSRLAPIREAKTIESCEKATANGLVAYVYDQVERKRRQASRQMLELARIGADNPEAFRRDLLLYLQPSRKFTAELEALIRKPEIDAWVAILDKMETPPDVRELHWSCQRVLESYPTHPSLLALSSCTRSGADDHEIARSVEEFSAALKFALQNHSVAGAEKIGRSIVESAKRVDTSLAQKLGEAFGVWLIRNGKSGKAISEFYQMTKVRNCWLETVLHSVNEDLPRPGGL